MSLQETLSFLRQVATFAGAYLTARGVASADQVSSAITQLSTIIPAAISLGSIVWSVYSHWNMKKVPENSVAISQTDVVGAPAVGATVALAPVAKVVGVLLVALALSFAPLDAFAQPLPRTVASSQTTAFLSTIQKWISTDNDAAIALATAIPDLQDPVGATCWKTFAGLGDVVQKHPLPVTLRLASDIEAARLIQMAIKKVCAEPACNQVWNDMQNQVAALAPIATPFTLASICSKVL